MSRAAVRSHVNIAVACRRVVPSWADETGPKLCHPGSLLMFLLFFACSASWAQTSVTTKHNARPCAAIGKDKITIRCSYTAAPYSASETVAEPRIVINRAVLSFSVDDESQMLVTLTLTNGSRTSVPDNYRVYLAIDDDAGHNYMRRPLPKVDLHKLVSGKRLTFSDRILAPAFRDGHYIVHLWLPSTDSLLEFDSAHNLLLSSVGVADRATGLNTLATFTAGTVTKAER